MEDKKKRRVLRALGVIEGHIRGVQRMIEAEAHWLEIIRQTTAIRGSLGRLNLLLLREHLSTTTGAHLVNGDLAAQRKALDEILSLLGERRLQVSEPRREPQKTTAEGHRCHPAAER